jgi:hypothetical protein
MILLLKGVFPIRKGRSAAANYVALTSDLYVALCFHGDIIGAVT